MLGILTPVQEYIVACEALILLNWVASYYLVKHGKIKAERNQIPVYVRMFFIMVAIVTARIYDNLYSNDYDSSYALSSGLVLYNLILLYKNISLILGIDITKYLKK